MAKEARQAKKAEVGFDDGFANLQLIYMQLGYFQMHMGET